MKGRVSYGVIPYCENAENVKVLLIRRKDSIGIIDFIQGKYNNMEMLDSLLGQMTKAELSMISSASFEDIWKHIWQHHPYKLRMLGSETDEIKMRFENKSLWLPKVYSILERGWDEPEWGFPKGGKNRNETRQQAALREFIEETGYSQDDVEEIKDIEFKETIHDCGKTFETRYYPVQVNSKAVERKHQEKEVSQTRWVTLNEGKVLIRPYHKDRLRILKNVFSILA
jgi:8-oxo-dGTP pyrophosphatase MutT (NUDIX family)